jgi:hypothetical protein
MRPSSTAVSAQVPNGSLYTNAYSAPTPTILNAAEVAFNTALDLVRGLPNATYTDLKGGAIAGLTLTPGLYKFTGAITVSSSSRLCP